MEPKISFINNSCKLFPMAFVISCVVQCKVAEMRSIHSLLWWLPVFNSRVSL